MQEHKALLAIEQATRDVGGLYGLSGAEIDEWIHFSRIIYRHLAQEYGIELEYKEGLTNDKE